MKTLDDLVIYPVFNLDTFQSFEHTDISCHPNQIPGNGCSGNASIRARSYFAFWLQPSFFATVNS